LKTKLEISVIAVGTKSFGQSSEDAEDKDDGDSE